MLKVNTKDNKIQEEEIDWSVPNLLINKEYNIIVINMINAVDIPPKDSDFRAYILIDTLVDNNTGSVILQQKKNFILYNKTIELSNTK